MNIYQGISVHYTPSQALVRKKDKVPVHMETTSRRQRQEMDKETNK